MKVPIEFQKPGNILLCHGYSFVAKTIQKCMEYKGIKRGYKIPKRIYNHAGRFVNGLYVPGLISRIELCEANADGVNSLPFDLAYSDKVQSKMEFAVLEPIRPYTEKQLGYLKSICYNLHADPTRYDFKSLLLWHVLATFTNEWLGRKDKKSKKRLYCYELAAYVGNEINEGEFDHDYYVDFWDIWLNDNFKLVYES